MIWHKIQVDGMTVRLGDRLESVRYTDKRGLESDDVEIRIIDNDGAVSLPRKGVSLNVAFGDGAKGVSVLVVVDEVAHDGPPDVITIRGRAANLRAGFLAARSVSYHNTTLGDVLAEVAGRSGAELKCAPELAAVKIEHVDQQNESDANFVTRLAQDYDSVASVKQGFLVFAPAGAAQSVSGTALAELLVHRSDTERHSYADCDRNGEVSGVEAKWQDTAEAEEKTALAGESGNVRSLKRTFASEAEAQAAADAEFARLRRCTRTLSLTFVGFEPLAAAEVPLRVSGIKSEVDAVRWVINEATHEYSSAGCKSSVQCEQR